MSKKKITILPGDGIGPEVTREAVKIITATADKYGVEIETEEYTVGGTSYDEFGTPLRDEVLEACKASDAVFLGAVGGPKWDNVEPENRPEAALLGLRNGLGLYTNLRPVKVYESLIGSSTLKEEVIRDVDLLVVRELTGGIYFGKPRKTEDIEGGGKRAIDSLIYSTPEIERITRKAFEAAAKRKQKVTSVDKSNILDTSRLWRKTVNEVAKDYPNIELEHMLVDNCAMQLVRNPGQFDVILTGNMFGDILSDAASMLTGSIGMLPSASLGDGTAMYEPVHGSAPDIAGSGKANPLAAIASAALLFRYSLDMDEAANDIEEAILEVLQEGFRTADLSAGSDPDKVLNTTEISDAIAERIKLKQENISNA